MSVWYVMEKTAFRNLGCRFLEMVRSCVTGGSGGATMQNESRCDILQVKGLDKSGFGKEVFLECCVKEKKRSENI